MNGWESFTLIMIMCSLAMGVVMLMFHVGILEPIPPCTVSINKRVTQVEKCTSDPEFGIYSFVYKDTEYSIRVNGKKK